MQKLFLPDIIYLINNELKFQEATYAKILGSRNPKGLRLPHMITTIGNTNVALL